MAEKVFWKKVSVTSFFLAFIIVLTHTISNIEPKFEHSVLTHSIFRYLHMYQGWAVHVFFMMSGILFFRNYDDNKIIEKYKSRLRSLVIPYLGWNIIGLLFWGLIGLFPFLVMYVNNMPIFDWTLNNFIEGIFHYKYNCVFWFIFELIALVFISPLVFTFIRHKYIGLFFIIGFILLSVFGKDLFIGMRCPETWYIYMIGGYLSIHHRNFVSNCQRSYSTVISLIVMFSISALFYFKLIPCGYTGVFIFQTIAFLTFWHSMIFLLPLYRPWMNGLPIFIYAVHYNISMAICKVFNFLPYHAAGLSIPALIVTTIIIMIICIAFAKFGKKYTPIFYNVLTGGR